MFKPLFALGRFPLLLEAAVAPMRLAPARRLPIAFGWLSKRASSEQLARWVRAGAVATARSCATRRTSSPAPTRRCCWTRRRSCRAFPGEVVFAWGADDRCFPVELGRRLAAQFRDARFVEVEDSYAFVPIDRPDALAALI